MSRSGAGATYMRATDAFTWSMERDPALRSTIVAVLWLDRAPAWDLLVQRMDRMSRLMPSMRQRVVESPLGLATPRWTYDPYFDLDWHLRRVAAPPPHTRDTVLALARQAAMDAFDRDRPLWEFTLVEGVEGPAGSEAAFVIKIHHSMSDGVGGMRLLTVMFDLEREAGEPGEMPPAPVGEEVSQRQLVSGAVASMAGRTAHLLRRGAERAAPAMAHTVRHPAATVRDTVAMARSVYRTAGPMLDTKSPVMRERAMNRRLATLEVPLESLKGASESVGVTVNDAYLAGLTGGLRRYHERHGATADALRVTMPVNLRAPDDTEWGNRITLQRLTLPVSERDPVDRMRAIHTVTEAVHEEPSLPVTDAIAGALNLLPVGYVGGVLKHIDFLASNVPGSPVPLYLCGGKVTGFFAFGPTIGTSLNATLISHGGTCDIGINIDTAAVPDHQALVDCLQESFDEISALARRSPAAAT